MAKKKGESRVTIQLECTVCRSSTNPNVYRYSTTKNRRNTSSRLELNKYCKFDRKHTLFKEVK